MAFPQGDRCSRDDGHDAVLRDAIARDTGRRYFPSLAAALDSVTVAPGPIQGSGWRGLMQRDEVVEEVTVVVRRIDAGKDDLMDAGAVRIAGGSAEDLDALGGSGTEVQIGDADDVQRRWHGRVASGRPNLWGRARGVGRGDRGRRGQTGRAPRPGLARRAPRGSGSAKQTRGVRSP